jgi:hypothetical protein
MSKEITQSKTASPALLLEMAVNQGAELEKLEKLMELQERYEANEARKAYHKSMAEFKQNPPKIVKDKKVEYKNTKYSHASLENVSKVINESLTKHGLSAAWHINQDSGSVAVTCTITHEQGHSESTTMIAPPDNSGSKNGIQAIGSTVTYLQRYTILALTGLAAGDDDDGRLADKKVETTVNENQLADLDILLTQKGVDAGQVLNMYKIQALSELTVANYNHAVRNLSVMQDIKEVS